MDVPTGGDGPLSLLDELGAFDEAYSPSEEGKVEKTPFLTRDDVLGIRATVDANYERDVKNLTNDTTDYLGPIRAQPPKSETETTSGKTQ